MALRKLTPLTVAALVVFLVAAPAATFAQRSFGCQRVWSGPSEKNDILGCLLNTERILDEWRHLVYPAVCVLLLVFMLVVFPMAFSLSVYRCRRPVETRSVDAARCWLWMWIGYAFLWSFLLTVFVVYGARILAGSVPSILDNTLTGPLRYFNDTAEKITDFSSNWTSGERRPMDFFELDLSAFTNVTNVVTGLVTGAQKDLYRYLSWAPLISYSIAALGVVMVSFLAVVAYFQRCVPWLPLLFSCFYWILGMVFLALGAAILVLAHLLAAGCGEVELQYRRAPGLFQWHVRPLFEERVNFAEVNRAVNSAGRHLFYEACRQLLEHCDDNPLRPVPPLECGGRITAADECRSVDDVLLAVQRARVKAVWRACPDPDRPCTLFECLEGCTNATPRELASSVLRVWGMSRNASIAFSYARPLLESNFVIDKLLGTTSGCNDAKSGALMLGTGFFVGGLTFGLGVYILLRGSCVFGRRNRKKGSHA